MNIISLRVAMAANLAIASSVIAVPAMADQAGGSASAGPQGSESGEIIVTARRTEERLQDVPISITVFNQQQLANRNIVIATDLATYTPSLSINQQYGAEKATFAIRGFVQDQATAPSVGVYFADVTEPRVQGGTTAGNNAPAGSFVDLQNVQVLKGPQGTLFGRNTTGGAILLVPQKPTDKLEGWVEGSAGNYGMLRGTAVLNIPLSDTFKVRAMIDRDKRDGYMKNHSGIGPADYDNTDYVAARLSIVGNITPNLENYTIFNYSNSFGNGTAPRVQACRTTGSGLVPLIGPMACTQLARQNARGDGQLDVDVGNPDPYEKIRQWSVINTTTWLASDALTIKNIASYTEFYERASFNLEGDNFTVPKTTIPIQIVWLQPFAGNYSSASANITEELQFQGKTSDGRLTWQAGGYYEHDPNKWSRQSSSTFLNCVQPGTLNCTNPLGFGNIAAGRTKLRFDTRGIYAQGTFKFTDRLSMTAGIRYTWDKIDAIGESTKIAFPPSGGTSQTCNNVLLYPSPTNPAVAKTVTDPAQCYEDFRVNSQKPTWVVDLEYKPIANVMAYAKYSRGYRSGGINLVNVGLETWNPEKVDAFEVGAKTSFQGGSVHGYFNIAAFYNEFSNQQLFASLIAKPSSGLVGGGAIVNAGRSRIQGVEIDGSATLLSNLRLDLGYTYLDTRLVSIDLPVLAANSPFSAIVPSATVGSSLALSPKNRVSATGTYTLPLDEKIGKISVGATFVHTDKQVISLATIPQFQDIPVTNSAKPGRKLEPCVGIAGRSGVLHDERHKPDLPGLG